MLENKKYNAALLFVLFLIGVGFAFIPSDGVADDQISLGYRAITAPTLTLVSSYPTIIGEMPARTYRVEVIASGANINYGPSNVTNSTLWPYITDGSSKEFTFSTRNPSIYFVIRGATTTAQVGMVAK